MEQKMTVAEINGVNQTIYYRVVEGTDGISYEGHMRDMKFTIRRDNGGLRFEPPDAELAIMKMVSAAVFNHEDSVSTIHEKN